MARKYTKTFEVERGDKTVEYEVDFAVTPGHPAVAPSFESAGGQPAEPPEVEWAQAYHCPLVRDPKTGKLVNLRDAKGRIVRERRPELDDLLDPNELIEHADDEEQGDYEDAMQARADAREEPAHRGHEEVT